MSPVRRLALTLFTSRTCSLCDTAKEALTRVGQKVPITVEQVDIHAQGNEEWQKYAYDIPVLHVEGKFMLQHRIGDEDALVERLRKEINKK